MLQWWVDVLDNFSDFSPLHKKLICEFLSVEEHVLDLVAVSSTIEESGKLAEVERLSEPQARESSMSGNDFKIHVKKVRQDNKVQKNSVAIVQGPDNHNPLYVIRISREGSLLSEATHRFAPYRDLYTKLNGEKVCDRLLTAPFPVTLRRSSIGIKMNHDQVEQRRQMLQTVRIFCLCSDSIHLNCSGGLIALIISMIFQKIIENVFQNSLVCLQIR
jgi:hypothetical protein